VPIEEGNLTFTDPKKRDKSDYEEEKLQRSGHNDGTGGTFISHKHTHPESPKANLMDNYVEFTDNPTERDPDIHKTMLFSEELQVSPDETPLKSIPDIQNPKTFE
jgi:hypothetical protein